MPRVKRGTRGAKRRKKYLSAVAGQRGARKKRLRLAFEALDHSLAYAYKDRKRRKREMRSLWIIRINAAAKNLGTTYNRLIHGLSKKDIRIDRKILADLAVNDPKAFSDIVLNAIN